MTHDDAFRKLHYTIQRLGGIDDLAKAGKALQEIIQEFSLTDSWALLLREQDYRLATDYFYYIINYLVIDNRAIRRRHNSIVDCTQGIIHEVGNQQTPRYIPDIHANDFYHPTSDTLLDDIGQSLALIPFSDPQYQHLAGILICDYQYFGDEHEGIIKEFWLALCALISQTLDRIRTIKALQKDAATDPLTGIYNRRTFVQIAEREIVESNRFKRILSFIIVDIDKFKNINDTEGHLMGDKVLVHCANVLINSVRSLDYVFRFAGDEFVVLMPETDNESLQQVITRIQENLENHGVAPAPTDYTISIGQYSGFPENLVDMFNRADSNLYIKKRRSTPLSSRNTKEIVRNLKDTAG